MPFIRQLLAAVCLTSVFLVVPAYGATVPSAKGDVTVALNPDPGNYPDGVYQLSLNSSGGKKATGGLSLLEPSSGAFVGGRTVLYCPGTVTAIVNEVNPAKKNSKYAFPDRYLIIFVEDSTNEVAFLGIDTLPTDCASVPTVNPTVKAVVDIAIS